MILIGYLKLNEKGEWIITYPYPLKDKDHTKFLALHPDQQGLTPNPFNNYGNGCQVKFQIEYLDYNELSGKHYNPVGRFIPFGKLSEINEDQKEWNDIYYIWRTTKNLDDYEISYNDWLKENYYPPKIKHGND